MNMNAKEFLSQAYHADQYINDKLEQIRSLRGIAENASSTLSLVSGGGTRNNHQMEDIISKIVDMESELNSEINKLVEMKQQIISVIQSIPTRKYQTLLESRYLYSKSWSAIMRESMYSKSSVHNQHRAALIEVEKLLNRLG